MAFRELSPGDPSGSWGGLHVSENQAASSLQLGQLCLGSGWSPVQKHEYAYFST